MAQDFFEDNLAADAPAPAPEPPAPARAVTDAAQQRMARLKESATERNATTAREIDELRRRQEALERERQALETLTRKQEEYETAKREIMDALARSVTLIQKDQVQATRLCELLSVMHDRFRDTLEELRGINEAGWSDATFETELDRARVLLEDARKVYRRGMAKIEAEAWHKAADGAAPAVVAHAPVLGGVPRGFLFWLKAGCALATPFVVLGILGLIVTLVLRRLAWI